MAINGKHVGGSFEDFLKEQGIYDEVMRLAKRTVENLKAGSNGSADYADFYESGLYGRNAWAKLPRRRHSIGCKRKKHPRLPPSQYFGADAMGCFFTFPGLFDQHGMPVMVCLDGFDDRARLPRYRRFISEMAASLFLQRKRKDHKTAREWLAWGEEGQADTALAGGQRTLADARQHEAHRIVQGQATKDDPEDWRWTTAMPSPCRL